MNKSEHYDFLCSQVTQIEKLPYFENIRKYPVGSFLLGAHNISSVIREHNLHIAISTTKAKSETNVKVLSKVLYSNVRTNNKTNNKSIAQQFEDFLMQFRDQNYPEAYYKKFAAVLPIDKLSNELCQIILDKNWAYIVASLATFELILSKISSSFNIYANIMLDSSELLNSSHAELNCVELLDMLVDEDKYDIKTGITDTVNMFVAFFNEINNQFYCD